MLLSTIIPSRRPIRPVHKDVEFYELKDAVELQGMLVPILVRPWEGRHEIVDGHKRFAVVNLLGQTEIDATVKEMDDKQVLVAQIRLNNLNAKHARAAILQLIESHGVDKLQHVGYDLGRSIDWVARILGLDRLAPIVLKAVERDYVDINSARLLAELPKERQRELLNEALTIPASELVPRLQQEVRHRREQKLSRRIVKKNSGPYLRSEKEILNELNDPLNAMNLITRGKVTTPFDAWKLALQWALRLDFDSLEERKLNE